MKQLVIFLGLLCSFGSIQAQEELHIHHINVEDGDATMIGIYNTGTGTYKSNILIDNAAAGQKSGYFVKIATAGLANKSAFQVYRVDNAGSTQTLLANFQCHSK